MLRVTWRNLTARRLRLALSGLAVALGVMFVSGAITLTDTIARSFEGVIAAAYDDVDVVVSGPVLGGVAGGPTTEPLPVSLVDDLRTLPEVSHVVPEIWVDGTRVIGDDGRIVSTFTAQVGGNWLGDADGVELRSGTGPMAEDEVAINAELARAGNIEVGDTIGVLTREPRRNVTVTGIFGYEGGRDSWFGETHVAFTDAAAQELLLGEPDVYTEVSVSAASGVSPVELRDAIQDLITDADVVVETGAEASETQGDLIREELSMLNDVLLGFAVVALLVAVFLVLNTFSILVAQRLRELALLRAMGASRRQVVGSVVVEAAVIGVVAGTIGLGAGIGVAALLTAWLAGEVEMKVAMGVPVSAIVTAYAVGVLVTVAAALVPAIRASRIAPVTAMQRSLAPDRSLVRPTVIGAIGTAAGLTLVAVGLAGPVTDTTVPLVLGGAALTFVGVIALTPALARPTTGLLGRAFAWSTPGELGRRNTGRQPRRTAVTASALMIGVALVTASSTFFGSFAASFGTSVDGRLEAELVIAGDQVGLTPPVFDPAVVAEVRELEGVQGVAAFWDAQVQIGEDTVAVRAVDDLPAWLGMTGVGLVDGASPVRLGSGEVAVAERIADRQGLVVGDHLLVASPRGGEERFEVVAVYDHNELFEVPLFSSADAPYLARPSPSEAFVALTDDGDAASVRDHLEALLADSPEVVVHDRSGYVEQQTREFDEAIVFVQVLLLLAIVIAVLGVVNTLALSVIERTRELGLLRALGLGRWATARMVVVEATVICVFGALLGIATGAGLGSAIVYALREEGFAELVLPWGLMGTYLLAAAFVGCIAAVIPAVRAANTDVLVAIAET